jgi:cytoskeletal protein RodZ
MSLQLSTIEYTTLEYTTLGEYLRETRITLGRELAAVAEETKISSRSLQAIEENNFAALPADVFARGFYALYAKSLLLDPEHVLDLYTQERPHPKKSMSGSMLRTGKRAQEVGTLSERSSFMPFSFFSLVILVLLLLGGVLCWYFSWNPATYLSHKLRSLEEPQRIEQVSKNKPASDFFSSNFSLEREEKVHTKQQNLFGLSYPSTATAAAAEEMPTAVTPLSLQTGTSHIPEHPQQ